jgi:hypothetical protein
MIPYPELCAALDRYNRKKQGLPVDEPAHAQHHEAIGDDAMVQEELIGEVSGAVVVEEEMSAEEAPRGFHEEATRELNLDDVGDDDLLP